MPTLNRKLLLRLILVTLVLGGGLFVAHYVQSDRATDALRWQAERAAENGRIDKAISYMRQYLELRPTDHGAATELGDLILKRGNGRKEMASVLFLYERVVREAPERDDLRRKLVDICLRLDRYGDAAVHAQTLLEKSPRDAELWEKLGVAQGAQSKAEDARASYAKAIEYDPKRVRSYELLAEVLIRQMQRADDARNLIAKMVEVNPTDPEAWLVRARYFRGQNKNDESLKDVERLLKLEPGNADGLLLRGEILQAGGDVAGARAAYTDGLDRHPKDIRFYRYLSYLEKLSGNVPGAITCLEKGVTQLPGAADLLTPLGELLLQQGEFNRVRDILSKLETRRDMETQASYLRGCLAMKEGKWDEAVAVFEALRTPAVALPGLAAQVNLLLAHCYERLGDRTAQVASLNRVVDIDVGHLDARLRFGAMHLAAGKLEEAIREYKVAANSPFANLSTRVTLGRLLIARARTTPNPDWKAVAEYTQALRDHYKTAVEPVLVAAEMHMARRQFDQAKDLLRKEAGNKVNDGRIWAVLADIALRTEGLLAASEVIDEAQSLVGDQVELRLARGRLWALDWQTDRAGRVRGLGQRVDHLTDAEQSRLFLGLAEVCSLNRDLQGIKQCQLEAARRATGDVLLRRSLLDTAIQTGDEALYASTAKELKTLGDEVVVPAAAAQVELRKAGATPRVVAESVRLLKEHPQRAEPHLLAASLAERTGDLKTAATEYAAALDLEPDNLTQMEMHLSFLMRHDVKTAFARLEQLDRDPRMSEDAFLGLLAAVSESIPPAERGRLAGVVEPLIKGSAPSLLWLARFEQSQGRTASALTLAKKAADLSPKLIDAWACLAYWQPAQAAEVVTAAKAVLDDASWHRLCAESLPVLQKQKPGWMPEFKKPEDLRSFAGACLRVFGARGRTAEAKALLNAMIEKSTTRPEDVAWARQNIALLSLSDGKILDRTRAANLVRDLKESPPQGVDEARHQAELLMLAARSARGAAREGMGRHGVELLTRVTADPAATPSDWFHLAQMHRLAGSPEKGETAMAEAMRRDESNVFFVVARVDDLLAQGKVTAIEPLLPKLVGAVDDSRATFAAARYYALAGQPEKCVQAVSRYVDAADPGSGEGPSRLRQAADMLDRAARQAAAKGVTGSKAVAAAAIDRYRASLRQYPEVIGPMTMLMAHEGQVQPALELLQSPHPGVTQSTAVLAAIAVVQGAGATPRQHQTVKAWLDAVLADNPGSIPLKVALAKWHASRQDFTAAEPVYRQVLAKEPEHVHALNDLAWILAPRTESLDEALKLIEKAIEVAGPDGELLDTRARVQIARGNFDKAIDDLRLALESGETSLRFFHLAIAQFKQLKKDDAVQSFREAKTRGLDPRMIHPTDMPTYKVLAAQMRD